MVFKPSERYIGLLRFRLTFVTSVLSFICGAVFYFGRIPALILGVGIFVLFLTAWVWYIPRFVNSHSVTMGEDSLSVRVGVIIRRHHIIPDKRCVYCRKVTGPLTRVFGIASVQIKMAHGVVTVFGLSDTDADRLICRGGQG